MTLDRVDCVIDGLRVKRVGETTSRSCASMVDEIVTLPDERIFEAMLWIMSRAKLVVEGAAAAPVGALLDGPGRRRRAGANVVCVLSGGNVNLDQLRGCGGTRASASTGSTMEPDEASWPRPKADPHRHLRLPARPGGALRRRPQARSRS